MIKYKCTAWARNADGTREPQATETIEESELSPTFVTASRVLGLMGANVTSWLACCEFARRMGLDPALWQLMPHETPQDPQLVARLAARLPVIIRVEVVQ